MRRHAHKARTVFVAFIFALLMMSASARADFYLLPTLRSGQPKVVPGGILYPNFNRAAEINASTIPWEWAKTAEILYSPPLSASDAHGVAASFTSAMKSRIGFGVGYLASVYGDAMLHGGYFGVGMRLKRFSWGATVRKSVFENDDQSTAIDLGVTFKPARPLDAAFVVRNLNHSPAVIAAIGSGRYSPATLELNALLPLFSTDNTLTPQYRLSIDSSLRLYRFDFGIHAQYSSFHSSQAMKPWSYTGAMAVWLSQRMSVKAQYTTEPRTWSIGLNWYWGPPTLGSLMQFVKWGPSR